MSTTTCPWSRATSRRCSTDAGADLDPAVGARQAGDDGQVGRPTAALHRAEPLVEHAARGQPGRGEQAGDLVEDAELLGDRAAVGVGVDEERREPAAGPARRRGRWRRWSGPARRPVPRPRRRGPASRRVPTAARGRPARPARTTVSAGSSPAATASRQRLELVLGHQRRGSRSGSPAGRPRRAPAPPGTIATGRTRVRAEVLDRGAGRGRARRRRARRRPPGRRWPRPAGRRRRRSA